MGTVPSDKGKPYEVTFNTWGYAWPTSWRDNPVSNEDPQRFGKHAYTGLYEFGPVKDLVKERGGKVHVVEMGSGTGAGAHHVCHEVLPECTYEAFDMQQAAINTCRRKFVPTLGGRLQATRADCTRLPVGESVADIVAICETHVTEMAGVVTPEDEKFFRSAHRVLKPGGMLVWGNAIPDATWQPCFDFMKSMGMQLVEVRDVTEQAIVARDQDEARVDAYVDHCIDRFRAFKIPVYGPRKREEARQALRNFYRNPGTDLYRNMVTRRDTYKVAHLHKPS
jgi:SAM-dependent methyltransferase